MKPAVALSLTIFHFLLALWGVWHHELWLDEAQHILLARESATLQEMVHAVRYEGHPLLWNFLLFTVTRLTDGNFALQCFHAAISSISVFLILRHAPFRWYISVAIAFGYFMFYEYSVICRNYAISVLLLLLLLKELAREKKNFFWLALLFALFVNTHLFSLFLASGLLIFCAPELLQQKLRIQFGFALIFLPALLFCLWHLQPPNDHFLYEYNNHNVFSLRRLSNVVHLPLLGLLPLPDLNAPNYWSNHPLVSTLPFQLLGIILVILPFWFLRKKPLLVFTYFIPLLFTAVFVYLSPLHLATRHSGFLSLTLFATLWLQKKGYDTSADTMVVIDTKQIVRNWYCGILLFVQLASGILFFILDLQREFSAGKRTASWLENNMVDSSTIVLSHFTSGPAIRVYTQGPVMYLEPFENGSYAKWNTQPLFLSDSLFTQRISYLLRRKKELVLVVNQKDRIHNLQSTGNRIGFHARSIASFTGATIQSENYYIYLLTKN